MLRPMPADLPLPLAALSDTVVLLLLSISIYIRDINTFAWSKVFAVCSSPPMIYFYDKSFFKDYSSFYAFVFIV